MSSACDQRCCLPYIESDRLLLSSISNNGKCILAHFKCADRIDYNIAGISDICQDIFSLDFVCPGNCAGLVEERGPDLKRLDVRTEAFRRGRANG